MQASDHPFTQSTDHEMGESAKRGSKNWPGHPWKMPGPKRTDDETTQWTLAVRVGRTSVQSVLMIAHST